MIPKIIHNVQLGNYQINPVVKRCLDSWTTFCPDYEVITWTEDNFDVSINPMTQAMWNKKQYSYLSDYIRVYACFHHGGIYLDTDLELIRSIDHLLNVDCFFAYEEEDRQKLASAVFGCTKGHSAVKAILDYFDKKLEYKLAPWLFSEIILPQQKVRIIEQAIFSPVTYHESKTMTNQDFLHNRDKFITPETCGIHWFMGSWLNNEGLGKGRSTEL